MQQSDVEIQLKKYHTFRLRVPLAALFSSVTRAFSAAFTAFLSAATRAVSAFFALRTSCAILSFSAFFASA